MTEDEMAGWHHRLNGHEFEQAPGVGDGRGGLGCCRPRHHKESDRTEWQNSKRSTLRTAPQSPVGTTLPAQDSEQAQFPFPLDSQAPCISKVMQAKASSAFLPMLPTFVI